MSDERSTEIHSPHPIDIESIRYTFEKDYRAGRSPQIDDYLAGAGLDRWQLTIELVHSELELRLRDRQPARLTQYLQRYPDLEHLPNELAPILETEIKIRHQNGESPDLREYESRYPQLGSKVREIFRQLGAAPPTIPGYECSEVVGQGGMGVVYKARQRLLNREVALKVIRQDKLADSVAADSFRDRFRREAEAVASINHPHVVQIFQTGEHEGDLFIAMELVEGQSLEQRLRDQGVLSPTEAAALVEKIAMAFVAIHDRGIIHRDLKPANILLTTTGEPKVADFGLARPIEPQEGQTVAGMFVGTPEYASPEQANLTGENLTPSVDVYGLGAVLYACLTGRPPFVRESLQKTLERVRVESVLPIREQRPDIPRDLETIAMKCLAKEASKRYRGARELSEDLRRWQDGKPIVARPVGKVERAWKWVQRNRAVSLALAGVVVSLMLGTGISTWQAIRAYYEANRADQQTKEAERNLSEAQFQTQRAREQEELAIAELSRNKILTAQTHWDNRLANLARETLESIPERHRKWEWHYLHRRFEGGLVTLYGHSGPVTSAVFSPDGSHIATSSADGTTRIWEATTGKHLLTLLGHRDEVTCVRYSPDGVHLATGSTDRTVRLWNAKSGKLIQTWSGHTGGIVRIAFRADGRQLASASKDNSVRVWDIGGDRPRREYREIPHTITEIEFANEDQLWLLENEWFDARVRNLDTDQILVAFKGHTNSVMGMAVSPEGERIATGSGDHTARIWDARSGASLVKLQGHTESVNRVAFSPDGRRLATASKDTTARLWNAETGESILEFKGHSAAVTDLAFSSDGRRVVTASADHTAKVWDVRTIETVIEVNDHSGINCPASISPDGTKLITGNADRTVHIRDAMTGVPIRELVGHRTAILATAFSPDRKRVATGGGDRTTRIWDVDTGKSLLQLKGHEGPVTTVHFSPDGKLIATGGAEGAVIVWDAQTGQPFLKYEWRLAGLKCVCFSPDSSRLVTAASDRMPWIWDTATGNRVFPLDGHTDWVHCISYSPDGSRIATASKDETARVWDALTGESLLELQGHSGSVNAVTFSPDGSRIVTGGDDKTIRIWDATTGQNVLILSGHSRGLNGVCFDPTGTRLVSSSGNPHRSDQTGELCIWHGSSKLALGTWKGHKSYVTCGSFSPDGSLIATGSDDKTVRIWDTRTGELLTRLDGHALSITRLAFSADGSRLASASPDRTIRIWDIDTSEMLRVINAPSPWIRSLHFGSNGTIGVTTYTLGESLFWNADTGEAVQGQLEGVETLAHPARLSPDGRRWLLWRDRVASIVDLELREDEQRYRETKSRLDPLWHDQQANETEKTGRWFAAAFHHRQLANYWAERDRSRAKFHQSQAHSFATKHADGLSPRELLPPPHLLK